MLTVVTHTDHDRRDLLERRVTEHRDLVLRVIVRIVVDDVRDGVAYPFVTCAFGFVTRRLGIRQPAQFKIEHVLFRPNDQTVGEGVVVILSLRR